MSKHRRRLKKRRASKRTPKNTQIIEGRGDSCPRCGQITQIREHVLVTEKELRRPYYYSRWFRCVALECKTTLIMPDRYKVFNRQEEEVSSV